MDATEGTTPRPTGLDRIVDHRLQRRDRELVVRPPLAGALIGVVAIVGGAAMAAGGADGLTRVFGAAFVLIGASHLLVSRRPWLSADAEGIRVGPFRRVRVPWPQLTGLTMRNVDARAVLLPAVHVERRSERALLLVPVPWMVTYGRVADLRHVVKLIALEAGQYGAEPVRWPEHLTFVDRDGMASRVR